MGNTKSGAARRRKEQRQAEADERQAAYDQLPLHQKLRQAHERHTGPGNSKEITKLKRRQQEAIDAR